MPSGPGGTFVWVGKLLKNTCYIVSGKEVVMSVEKAIRVLTYEGVRLTHSFIARNVTMWISHTLETSIKFRYVYFMFYYYGIL